MGATNPFLERKSIRNYAPISLVLMYTLYKSGFYNLFKKVCPKLCINLWCVKNRIENVNPQPVVRYIPQLPSILEIGDANEPEIIPQNVRICFPGIKRIQSGGCDAVTTQTQAN